MLAADLRRVAADKEREDAERMDLLFGKLNLKTRVESRPDPLSTSSERRGLLGLLFGR
ncbi:hypothetical protein [Rhizobium binae]|uniref:hypothetical protein n=1 Tax=Rhizobium binae TaxID=1138190 RepID=UPI003DA7CF73